MKIPKLLPLILSICILAPMANDLFMASLPTIAHEFATLHVQLMMTVFMFGLALSMLLVGPLSDRFGRKPILLIGLAIFIVGSCCVTVAMNMPTLLGGRLLQAIGAATFIPGAMAIARDSYSHDKLAHVIPIIMGCVTVIPTVAPLVGAFLQAHFNWRANFITQIIIGLLYLLLIATAFTESLAEKNHHAIHWRHLIRNYLVLLRHKNFICYTLAAASVYGIIFGYITAAPFLFIHNLHISVGKFAAYFATFAAILAISSFSIPVLTKVVSLTKIMLVGASILLLGSIVFLIANLQHTTPLTILLPISLCSIGMGLVRASSITNSMRIFPPKSAGSCSAMINFIAFMISTISTGVISILPNDAKHFAYLLFVLAGLTLIFAITAVYPQRRA